jgi:hypothetical protein
MGDHGEGEPFRFLLVLLRILHGDLNLCGLFFQDLGGCNHLREGMRDDVGIAVITDLGGDNLERRAREHRLYARTNGRPNSVSVKDILDLEAIISLHLSTMKGPDGLFGVIAMQCGHFYRDRPPSSGW